MRPGQQQNKQRMRGRGGRKGPNPMSRSFESNGPDVKIRGTAQHIADKYMALARDAGAAGDRVMAENYLQHAEHYGRIVAAAMGQFQPSQPERDYGDFDEDGEEEGLGPEANQPFGGQQERPHNAFNGERPQNGGERQGGERHPNDRQGFRDGQNGQGPRGDRRDNRGDRPFQNRDGQNRDGQNRDHQNRDGFARDNGYRDDRGRDDRRDRGERDNRQPGTGPQPFVQAPEFEPEGGAPRQDGGRFEGGRRESRRERGRLNERSGERRFEERFGRPRQGDEARGDAPAERQDAVGELPAFVTTPAPVPTLAPAPVPAQAEPVAAQPSVPVTGADVAAEAKGAEPRVRGRRRREDVTEGAAPAEAAATPVAPMAAPEASPSEEASTAPIARRRSPKAAPATEAPVAAEDEAAPKRRVAKPRRKKDEGEADGAPALATSDS